MSVSAEGALWLEGGCLCGAVRYRVTGKPYHLTHCHCRMCRRASGAPFVTWFSVKSDEFQLLRGEPARFVSSPRAARSFCPLCGTQLTFQLLRNTAEIDITLCSLDQPEVLQPEDHTWTSSRLPWIQLADGLPLHTRTRDD
jgi:hypothetical protein